jgi:hypothetical protein
MIGHYDLKFGDVVEFRKKFRVLKVKTLDESVKNMLIDESLPVKELVEVICERIGLVNPEEYSLIKDETDVTSATMKKDKKIKKLDAISSDASKQKLNVRRVVESGKNYSRARHRRNGSCDS